MPVYIEHRSSKQKEMNKRIRNANKHEANDVNSYRNNGQTLNEWKKQMNQRMKEQTKCTNGRTGDQACQTFIKNE